ncbi:MAG: hypothetical protein F4210_10540 [Holophagales bacterium]|nr:hypothetical protein [Holophagales bacterium]MYB19195.1 hypothetical protein [Holophagales bacterium]MYF95926.1 hypothetical protein [Holophagales bacterium]MYH24858.1 hypothetical protein [Holophagales bacterium]
MTNDDRKPGDDSGLGPRALLIFMLFAAGVGPDAPLENIRTSILAMSYAACLVLMVVATLRAMGLQWANRPPAAEPAATPAPDWHAYRTFTDPLFQVPAIFCVILYAIDLTADLMAEPPETEAAVWFLAVIAGLAFAAVGGTLWRASRPDDAVSADSVAELLEVHRTEQRRTPALRDPWFAVPATAAPFLLVIRPGLRDIEEGPPYLVSAPFVIGALVVVVALIAFSAVRERRKRARASAAVDQQSVGVTREDGGAS